MNLVWRLVCFILCFTVNLNRYLSTYQLVSKYVFLNYYYSILNLTLQFYANFLQCLYSIDRPPSFICGIRRACGFVLLFLQTLRANTFCAHLCRTNLGLKLLFIFYVFSNVFLSFCLGPGKIGSTLIIWCSDYNRGFQCVECLF